MSSLRNKLLLLMALICSLSNSCSGQSAKETTKKDSVSQAWNQTIPGNFSSQSTSSFDSTQVASFSRTHPDLQPYMADVRNFYQKRKYTYAWFQGDTLIQQADNLSNRILNLESEGVFKQIPYQKELDSLLFNFKAGQKRKKTDLELMLTSQYFVFSKLAWQGMNAATSRSVDWYLPRKKLAYDEYLDSILKSPAKELANGEPVYRQYDLLKNYLRKYRTLDSADSWRALPDDVGLKPGLSGPIIGEIRKRLSKLGDFAGDTTDMKYDEALEAGVQNFQERHGLKVTGLLDKETMGELNVPLKKRIRQILVNMERSRWLPVRLDGDYLGVNIPEFKLHVYHGDSLLWSCKVVVGQTMHRTAVFYGEVKYVVFSPYWNVPNSIVENEVLPAMRKNPGYLGRHHMEITGYQNGLPVVRQLPGPDNSLGLVKFLFPNSYNIYLHDTPAKSLFGESSRAFSHGCIRVGEPFKLATFLLKDRPEWTTARINQAMHAGKEQFVALKEKVPVFIAYFTAFTDRENRLNFRKDIYNMDQQLAETIMSGQGEY